MTVDVTIKQNDTKVRFSYIPKIDGVPVPPADFVGATLKFILRNESLKISRDAVITPDDEAEPPHVTFDYDPEPEDVAATGKFRQEWRVVTIDGKPLTYPNGGYNIVEILPSLA
jgi:hypothetical protein